MSDLGAKVNPRIDLTPDMQGDKLGGFVLVGSIPAANDCLYLGSMASVSTEIAFEEFLDDDHTLTAWFMPQFPFGDCGAIFGTFGPGTYMVGQGDYRTGDMIFVTKKGSPVLSVVIGAQRALYLAPSWQAGTWHHIAVVRKAGTVALYLDGARLQPVSIVSTKDGNGNITATSAKPAPEVQLGQSFTGKPTGKLTLGSGRHPHRLANAQSYGLLDDVALFERALTDNELKALVAAKRTTGKEPGLVAGWNFDASRSFLPLRLRSKMESTLVVDDLRISVNRDSAKDRALLSHPAVLDGGLVAVNPPFRANEEWRVQQGVNDPLGSHCGFAAFCWDLQRVNMTTGNASVRSCLSGEIYSYLRDKPVDPAKNREANEVSVISPMSIITYLHLAGGSLTDTVTGGEHSSVTTQKPWPNDRRQVTQGDELGKVGPKANHLHLAGHVLYTGEGAAFMGEKSQATAALAFSDVEVRFGGVGNWMKPGAAYIPQKDDHLRLK